MVIIIDDDDVDVFVMNVMIINIIQSLYGGGSGRNILLIMDLDAPDWHYFQAPGTFIPSLYVSKTFFFKSDSF